ncbi:MAG TPA: hypothetical protein ENL03_03980 [Phycisphaerae bacterium]|nr:hypothetical protein [Phycisphaerae bacterium]
MASKKLYLIFVCSVLWVGASALVLADDAKITPTESDKPVVIAPRPAGPVKAKKTKFPPSGTAMAENLCTLQQDDSGWTVAVFEKTPGNLLPLRLRILPCGWLDAMENSQTAGGQKLFLVTGVITVHKEICYLLPITASTYKPANIEKVPPADNKTTPDVKPEPEKAEDPKKTADDPKDDDKKDDGTHSPDDIIDRLFKDGQTKPFLPEVIKPEETPHKTRSVAPVKKSLKAAPRGSIVDNRIAYIVPANDEDPCDPAWWKVVFVSDNTLQDEPILILPNRILERVQAMYKPHLSAKKIRVSGHITTYKGRNYLLLKKAMPVRQMGQF